MIERMRDVDEEDDAAGVGHGGVRWAGAGRIVDGCAP
jgi:hypothetical protein